MVETPEIRDDSNVRQLKPKEAKNETPEKLIINIAQSKDEETTDGIEIEVNTVEKENVNEIGDGNGEKLAGNCDKKDKPEDENKENLVKEQVEEKPPIKSILKHGPLLTEKHVDFNTEKIEVIPFDETKDYTIEIQIVEKITPKIVSYRELFAQMKAAEAAAAAAAGEQQS